MKQRIESGSTYFKLYKEGDSENASTFFSLKDFNIERMKKHTSLENITFDTHVIEINSSDPSTIPVTIQFQKI